MKERPGFCGHCQGNASQKVLRASSVEVSVDSVHCFNLSGLIRAGGDRPVVKRLAHCLVTIQLVHACFILTETRSLQKLIIKYFCKKDEKQRGLCLWNVCECKPT